MEHTTSASDVVMNENKMATGSKKRPSSPLQLTEPTKQYRFESDPIPTSNRFSALPQDVSSASLPADVKEKEKRPPPIYVTNVNNFQELLKALVPVADGVEFKCKSSVDSVTVYASTSELYRKFINYLKTANATFHCFQLPEEKPFRVVLRGLHFSTPVLLIKDELNKLGFEVMNVTNILSRSKKPLPLFFLDLNPQSSHDDIYKITRLLFSVVNIEDVRQTRKVVQCTRCQKFNHTKAYCYHPPKCVKCAGDHLTIDCKKPRDSPATCALCKQQHTANYRGCSAYQDLKRQQQRFSSKIPTAGTSSASTLTAPLQDSQSFPPLRPSDSSYLGKSSVPASPRRQTQNNSNTSNIVSNTNNFVNNDFVSEDCNNLCNRNFVNIHPSYHSHSNHTFSSKVRGEQHSSVDSNNSLSHVMSNFLNDIKNIIMPLMSLLTQLTQALLTKNAP